MMELPDEVMTEVFSQLDTHRFREVSLVSTSWANLLRDSQEIWQKRMLKDFCHGARGGREKILVNGVNFAVKRQSASAVYRSQVELRRKLMSNPLVGHSAWIWDVSTVGEDHAVSCSDNGALQYWKVGENELENIGTTQTLQSLIDVVVKRGTSLALTCGMDGYFHLCDIEESQEVRRYPSDFVSRMDLSGENVLCAAMDDKVRLFRGLLDTECYDEAGGKKIQETILKGHTDWVRSVSFVEHYGDGRSAREGTSCATEALSSADDSCACVFDLEREIMRMKMPGAPSPAAAVAASFDGRIAASGHTTGPLNIWDLRDGRMVVQMNANSDENMHTIAFSKDGLALISGSNHRLATWDLRMTARCENSFSEQTSNVSSVRLSDSGMQVFVCAGENLYCTKLN